MKIASNSSAETAEASNDLPARPRILFAIATLGGGGAERQVRLLLPEMARRGAEVALFSRLGVDDIATFTDAGVRCFPISSSGNYDLTLVADYVRTIRSFQPNIVQSFLAQMDILCALLPRRGARWILSERSSPENYDLGQGVFTYSKSLLRRRLGSKADLVIANSASGLPVWEGHPSVKVIPNAIDLAEIDSIARGYHGESDAFAGRRVALSIGRLSPEKRMDLLIEAAALVHRRANTFRLIVLGEGPDRSKLEGLIAARGLADVVLLPGFKHDPSRWLKSAEVFVSASSYEGQPNAVLEAAACGVPMILSDIPPHRNVVPEGALFVDGTDPAQYANEIEALFTSSDRPHQIAVNARRAVEHLSVREIAEKYLATYQTMLDRAPRR